MKKIFCLAVGLSLSMIAFGQSEPKKETKPEPPKQETKEDAAKSGDAKSGDSKEAVEIFTKADAATKKVQAVRYVGNTKGVGAAESAAAKIKGTYTLSGPKNEQSLGKFRFEGKVMMPGASEERDVIVASDGDKYWLVDHKNKTVHEDIDPAVLGRIGQTVIQSAMREFVHPNPFGDEIKGEKHELRGDKDINGEKCHEVYVQYSGGMGETVWFISAKDNLPRRADRTNQGRQGKIVTTQEISELSVDPKFTDDPFKVTVPEGYKKSDDAPQS